MRRARSLSDPKSTTPGRRAAFTIAVTDAEGVALVGTFNNQDPRRHPMPRKGCGPLKKSVLLAPGAMHTNSGSTADGGKTLATHTHGPIPMALSPASWR